MNQKNKKKKTKTKWYKKEILNKYRIISLFLLIFLIFFPINVNGEKKYINIEIPNEFHLYYGFWGAEFIVENQNILRNDLQEMWNTNYTSDFRWQSVAHLFLDFSYLSNGKYNCSVEFKILNITRHGSLIYDLSQNHFYMQENSSNDIYVPFFFNYTQEQKDQDIFCNNNATSYVFMKDINYTKIDTPLRGLDYSYYNLNLNTSRIDVLWPEDSEYAEYLNTVLFYDYLNGFLIYGNLPFDSFEIFCRLAISTFNDDNFSANPELKLADTNLNFSLCSAEKNSNSNNPENTIISPISFIIAGFIFGVPMIIIITKSFRDKQKKGFKNKKYNRFRMKK
ncbi:hypothetical protein [Candidatus Harpocratesius sp.]